MAKRKRLAPPAAPFVEAPGTEPARGPFSPAPRPAPIAGVAREAAATAALDEMAETLTRARDEGRMVMLLPLDAIVLDHLVRDRIVMAEPEMQSLMQSLKSRGQQTPIEVMDLGSGRYGLISGWRRCQALMRLARETNEDRFGTVLALLRRPDQAPDAYLAMVEENEIRVGLSFYERARIVAKSVEQGVFETEKQALQTLFANASRAKRSKVGSFVRIVHALDGVLRFPHAMSERAGLALAKGLDQDRGLAARLREGLTDQSPADAETEQALIDTLLSAKAPAPKEGSDKGKGKASAASLASDPTEEEKEPAANIRVRSLPNGDVLLTGAGLTPAFRTALQDWLKARGTEVT